MRRVDHSARSRSDGNGGEGEKKKLAFVSRRMLVLRVSWGCVELTQSLRGERKMNELGKWRRRYTRRVISGEYGLGKRRLIAVDGGKIRGFFLGKNAPETRVSLGNSGGQIIRGRYASSGRRQSDGSYGGGVVHARYPRFPTKRGENYVLHR